MIEKPQLFLDKREFSFIALLFLIVISIRLYILYSDYKIFISKPFYFTYADIIRQYKKDKNLLLNSAKDFAHKVQIVKEFVLSYFHLIVR